MTEALKFLRKCCPTGPALVGLGSCVAMLGACGSRFTGTDHAASAGTTSVGGYAGRASASAGETSSSSGSGGAAPSIGGSPAQGGNSAGSSPGGSSAQGGTNASGGTFSGSGGSIGGQGGALAAVGGAGGAIATAGTAGIAIISGGSANWSPCTPLTMIDDMEDGNDRNCPNQARNGEWWASTGTTTGSIDPPKTGEFAAYPLGADARPGSQYGMRLSGNGFGHEESDWASLGFNLIDNTSYDLTRFTGLAFYAKNKSQATGIALHVEIATDTTTPLVDGGACQSDCSDH